MNVKMNYNRDRIKGLILWRFNAYCGAAAIHEVEMIHLVYCGSCIAAAAIHEPQCTR